MGALGYESEDWKEHKWTVFYMPCLLIDFLLSKKCQLILHAEYNSSIFGHFIEIMSVVCSSQIIFWIFNQIIKKNVQYLKKTWEITAANYHKMMSPTTMAGFVWITILALLIVKLLTLLLNSD